MPDAIEGQEPAAQAIPEKGQEPVALPQAGIDAELKEARAEAAKHRTENKKLADRLEALENEKLSDTEKKDKRLAELEAAEQTRASRERDLLIKIRVTEFTADTDCLDKSWLKEKLQAASLELDDQGIPTDESLEKALKALKKQYAALFKPDGPQASTASTGAPVNADRTQQAAKITGRVGSLSDPALWTTDMVTKR